ncbi:MAG: hypothetical protein MJE66_06990, partial [Proteobacteria bacterium]|nr:hypothetical protein [Pseudomonadota bacterium]
ARARRGRGLRGLASAAAVLAFLHFAWATEEPLGVVLGYALAVALPFWLHTKAAGAPDVRRAPSLLSRPRDAS